MTKEEREKIRRENIDRPGEDAVCCSACRDLLDHCDEMDAALRAEKDLGDELAKDYMDFIHGEMCVYVCRGHGDEDKSLIAWKAARGREDKKC